MAGLVQIAHQTKLSNKENETRNLYLITRLRSETNGESCRTKRKEKQKDRASKVHNSDSD